MTERQLQQMVLDLARLNGWLAAHFHDSRRQVKRGVFVGDTDAQGFPDCVLVRGERLVVCELKAEKGRLSRAQVEWLERLAEAGVEAYVVRPGDFDALALVLRHGVESSSGRQALRKRFSAEMGRTT